MRYEEMLRMSGSAFMNRIDDRHDVSWPSKAETAPELSADELVRMVGTDSAPFLVDVREPEEFATWCIPGTINIPLSQLRSRLGELSCVREVVLVCATGERSNRAAHELRKGGVPAVNLAGGMLAWAVCYDTAELDLGAADIVQVRRQAKGCLSYLVGAAGEAFAVDPTVDIDQYLGLAARHGWRITRVMETHLHADHLSGSRALAAAARASLHLSAIEGHRGRFEPLADHQWLPLGEGTHLGVTVFATPGHTEGSVVFEVGGRAVLTGDTLFVDGVGRSDRAHKPDKYARQLYRSLHTKVLALSTDAVALPAHYGERTAVQPGVLVGATLEDLRRDVAQLAMGEEAFVAWARSRVKEPPPHLVEILEINSGRVQRSLEECRWLEVGPNRCAA